MQTWWENLTPSRHVLLNWAVDIELFYLESLTLYLCCYCLLRSFLEQWVVFSLPSFFTPWRLLNSAVFLSLHTYNLRFCVDLCQSDPSCLGYQVRISVTFSEGPLPVSNVCDTLCIILTKNVKYIKEFMIKKKKTTVLFNINMITLYLIYRTPRFTLKFSWINSWQKK